jgi:outer membrane protein assembly factor BamA
MTKLVRYRVITGIFMLTWCSCFSRIFCQNNYRLSVNCIDKDSTYVSQNLALQTSFENKARCHEYLNKLPSLLLHRGYIAASVDSVLTFDNQTIVRLFVGPNYSHVNLHIHANDESLTQQAGWKYKKEGTLQLSFKDYYPGQEKLLDYFENNGYPFAKITLDSIDLSEERVHAVLKIDKGPLYHIDSIRLFGPGKISSNFIHRYLNIERGSLYRKEQLEKINQRLLELPYLEQVQPWDITMLNTGSSVNLYLKQKKSNQINVLAGFLPSNQQVRGKLLLTVDANLQLQNALGTGESVGLVWQQIQPKSPRLHFQYTQPYLFNSRWGLIFCSSCLRKTRLF